MASMKLYQRAILIVTNQLTNIANGVNGVRCRNFASQDKIKSVHSYTYCCNFNDESFIREIPPQILLEIIVFPNIILYHVDFS